MKTEKEQQKGVEKPSPAVAFSPPDITEEEIREVADTLRSGWITTGPKTKQLEKEIADFCHTKRAVCLNSATACMEMTLRLFGIGKGDEVITSAYTYTATASAICHTGAVPVLVDVAKDCYEMDYEAVKRAITPRTKAIVPVDIAGVMCDYETIRRIVCEKADLFVPGDNKYQKALGRILIMADSAHGFGAEREGKRSGEAADVTTFSFHAVKNFTTAEGGAVTWREIPGIDSEEIYKEFMLLSLHGQSKDALAKTKLGAWEYDILSPAYKCNMTDIMAAIGLVQMRRYPKLLDRRRQIVKMYEQGLEKINRQGKKYRLTSLSHYNEAVNSSGHLFLMRLQGAGEKERGEIIEKLAKKGVATNVHYKPLPLLTAYRNLGFDIADYKNAFALYENEITLPLHTKLDDEDVSYVLRCLEEVLE
ncbi:MAG: DegT/DnrJ/EryC1/StrS aminotransferase family protein [Lachnospiraceae bacterium]|nr:DegT/DnrJ/EryC1/StrS aminotransferase family protein [Lachnospiraceae bacterium]